MSHHHTAVQLANCSILLDQRQRSFCLRSRSSSVEQLVVYSTPLILYIFISPWISPKLEPVISLKNNENVTRNHDVNIDRAAPKHSNAALLTVRKKRFAFPLFICLWQFSVSASEGGPYSTQPGARMRIVSHIAPKVQFQEMARNYVNSKFHYTHPTGYWQTDQLSLLSITGR